ncbi:MAG: CaiB/BaiF CoA transferase family protein [Janthinobacterium lividum]
MLATILADIRVLDLTQNVAGPFCTQVLGDLGAEVLKVERPGRGDDTRLWQPVAPGGQSATFLALNRNKRSVCIDLDHPEGQAAAARLAAGCDVVIHSMKPGSAEARGLGFDSLSAANPRLIHCAISAFGSVGPLRALPGYDPLLQAFTGVMSSTGNDGEDPVRVGVSLIDMGTGLWAAIGILGAVIERMRTGRGVSVEASLMDTGVSWMTIVVGGFLASGTLPRKMGSAVAMTAPYELYASADGRVFIAAGNDNLFQRVCAGLGDPALAQDSRFLTNALRVANRPALRQAIEALTAGHSTAAIVAALRRAGAPCSELHDVGQMMAHDQVAASGMIAPLPVRDGPEHRVVAMPLKADGARSTALQPPPLLGADTDQVLAEAGFSADDIAALRSAGAVG